MRFHGVFLGRQHEIWSKQHNGKVRWDCFGAQTIEIADKTIKVYPIGAFCWIWSNEEDL
jgi:hypothetical protein